MRQGPVLFAFVLAAVATAACTTAGDTAPTMPPGDPTSSTSTTSTSSVPEPSTTAPLGTTTGTATTTPNADPTNPSTTVRPGSTTTTSGVRSVEEIDLGRSVRGRHITAIHRRPSRTAVDPLVVLVVGDIHGDEAAGVPVAERLRTAQVPSDIDLWIVPSMNPDGVAADTRHNANGVDLNRNFPGNWSPVAQPGHWEYSGPSAASEPETKLMVELIEEIRPDLTFWFHQDLFRISPGTGRSGRARERYAELTGLPLLGITGGTYTGTAGGFTQRAKPGAISITVELGPGLLSTAGIRTHADAVITVAVELASGVYD